MDKYTLFIDRTMNAGCIQLKCNRHPDKMQLSFGADATVIETVLNLFHRHFH